VAKWIVCMVVGLICVVGMFGTGGFDSTDITCDGETMTRADICEETNNGVTERMTYAEMVADERANEKAFETWGRWALLAAGIVFLGGGVAGIIARKRKGPATPAVPGQAPMPPGQAPPPYQQPAPYQQNMPPQQQNWHPGAPQNYPQQPGGFGPQGGNQDFGPQG